MRSVRDPSIARGFSALGNAMFPDPTRVARAQAYQAQRQQYLAHADLYDAQRDRIDQGTQAGYDASDRLRRLNQDPTYLASPQGTAELLSDVMLMDKGLEHGPKFAVQSNVAINGRKAFGDDLSYVLTGATGMNHAHTPQGHAETNDARIIQAEARADAARYGADQRAAVGHGRNEVQREVGQGRNEATRYTADQRLAGTQYATDGRVQVGTEANQVRRDVGMAGVEAQRYGHDQRAAVGHGANEVRREVGQGANEAVRYGHDQRAAVGHGANAVRSEVGHEANQVRRDVGMAGVDANRYRTDSQERTTLDRNQRVENVGMDGNARRENSANLATQGRVQVGLDANGKRLEGTQYSADQRLAGSQYTADSRAQTAANKPPNEPMVNPKLFVQIQQQVAHRAKQRFEGAVLDEKQLYDVTARATHYLQQTKNAPEAVDLALADLDNPTVDKGFFTNGLKGGLRPLPPGQGPAGQPSGGAPVPAAANPAAQTYEATIGQPAEAGKRRRYPDGRVLVERGGQWVPQP